MISVIACLIACVYVITFSVVGGLRQQPRTSVSMSLDNEGGNLQSMAQREHESGLYTLRNIVGGSAVAFSAARL